MLTLCANTMQSPPSTGTGTLACPSVPSLVPFKYVPFKVPRSWMKSFRSSPSHVLKKMQWRRDIAGDS